MARGKSSKLKPFQKLLTIMISGKQVTTSEIDATLGKEIHMYRLSTYIWHIKTNANGVVKAIKDGRKVVAYQLMNVDKVMNEHMKRNGVLSANFVPGQAQKIVKGPKKTAPVVKLQDLKADPVVEDVEEEVAVDDEMEISEIKETV